LGKRGQKKPEKGAREQSGKNKPNLKVPSQWGCLRLLNVSRDEAQKSPPTNRKKGRTN